MVDTATSPITFPRAAGDPPRYALVFAPSDRHLEAASAFAGDPDRVLLELDGVDLGTTAAVIVPLLWLLTVDPDADLLVLDGPRGVVYVGSVAHLADLVRERAPAWWNALAHTSGAVPGEDDLCHLAPSDLATDVLLPSKAAAPRWNGPPGGRR